MATSIASATLLEWQEYGIRGKGFKNLNLSEETQSYL